MRGRDGTAVSYLAGLRKFRVSPSDWYDVIMAKLVLDLHDIFNRGGAIDSELRRVIEEAVDRKIATVEIIPGKGSGQLKKRVLRFLAQPDVKKLYHRLEKDDKNFGRIFVHFRF
jgi:DNA-nicking Smr family endonuclease